MTSTPTGTGVLDQQSPDEPTSRPRHSTRSVWRPSAGIVRGRRLTSTVGIRDDVVNAGAEWVDQDVVVDGNIISSRVPKDLPAFGEAMVGWLAGR